MRPSRRCAVVAALSPGIALAVPSTAGALGLPGTFPRSIVILDSTPQIHATGFQASVRTVGRKVRVTVRVTATGVGKARRAVIAVGPCTRGTATGPLCKPTARATVTFRTTPTDHTRSFLVARPSARRDALRVTLTPAGVPVPFLPERVGGGGGLGEILLNGGTWRLAQGTRWGVAVTEPPGVTIDLVKFNSRTYAWSGVSQNDLAVSTKIGYEGVPPRWDFDNTMRAGRTFGFRRTPSTPIQDERSAPRAFTVIADAGSRPLFRLRVPLPVWGGDRPR